jgi:hypothetical protein
LFSLAGVLLEGDPILFNPCGVIAANPEKYAAIQFELANDFIGWLISPQTIDVHQTQLTPIQPPGGWTGRVERLPITLREV